MNLKVLNKIELDQRIKTLVSRERELLHDILLTIKEIDLRRTYLELGFPNLFSYLVEGVGYSAGSAQRRIEGARLLKEIPSLGEKIQTGEVKLTQISMVQKAARDVYKTTSKKVTAQEKAELLEQLINKNYQESQREVASFFDMPVLHETSQKIQADESIRLQLTVSKELLEKIQLAQGLLSHAVPNNDILAYIEYLTDRVIKQKLSVSNDGNSQERKGASTVEVKGFSQRTKKLVLARQKCCQYVDPVTRKQCQSRWFLQVDHRQSLWAQGDNSLSNAQILCGRHNRMKYHQEAGITSV